MDALLLSWICEWFKKSMCSDWENLAAERKLPWSCWRGLLLVGLNPPRPVLADPGMLTGAELPSRPDEASPTDIEFVTVGDSDSRSLSRPDKFNGSSKLNSSKALPSNRAPVTHRIETQGQHNSPTTLPTVSLPEPKNDGWLIPPNGNRNDCFNFSLSNTSETRTHSIIYYSLEPDNLPKLGSFSIANNLLFNSTPNGKCLLNGNDLCANCEPGALL